jgi:hypothetical protein
MSRLMAIKISGEIPRVKNITQVIQCGAGMVQRYRLPGVLSRRVKQMSVSASERHARRYFENTKSRLRVRYSESRMNADFEQTSGQSGGDRC